MKATGVVRKLDELGRVVMPIELRRVLGIQVKDPIEIYVDGENIILRKYSPTCTFCGESTDTREYKGKVICQACVTELTGKA